MGNVWADLGSEPDTTREEPSGTEGQLKNTAVATEEEVYDLRSRAVVL